MVRGMEGPRPLTTYHLQQTCTWVLGQIQSNSLHSFLQVSLTQVLSTHSCLAAIEGVHIHQQNMLTPHLPHNLKSLSTSPERNSARDDRETRGKPKVQPMMNLDAVHLEPGAGSVGSGPLAEGSISDVV